MNKTLVLLGLLGLAVLVVAEAAQDFEDMDLLDLDSASLVEKNSTKPHRHHHARVYVNGVYKCVAGLRALRGEVKRDNAVRRRELMMIKKISYSLAKLNNIKEVSAVMEALDLGSELERKHAEVVGKNGIMALLKKLSARLRADAIKDRNRLRKRAKKCAKRCHNATKYFMKRQEHAELLRNKVRTVLRARRQRANKSRGYAVALRKVYLKEKADRRKNNKSRAKELKLIEELLHRVVGIENVKEDTQSDIEEDSQEALVDGFANLAKTLDGSVEFVAIQAELQRKHARLNLVRNLLHKLRAKILAESKQEAKHVRHTLRKLRKVHKRLHKQRRAARHARHTINRIKRVIRSVRRNRHRVAKTCARRNSRLRKRHHHKRHHKKAHSKAEEEDEEENEEENEEEDEDAADEE